MGGLVFLVAFATLAFSFRLALRRVTQPCMPFPGGGDSQPVALIPRQLQLRGTGVAALVALVLGIFASNGWLTCIDRHALHWDIATSHGRPARAGPLNTPDKAYRHRVAEATATAQGRPSHEFASMYTRKGERCRCG